MQNDKDSAIRFYLDESGTFEGNQDSLVCGLRIQPDGPDLVDLHGLLKQGVKALTRAGGTLKDDRIHGVELRRADRNGYIALMEAVISGLERKKKTVSIFAVLDRARVKFKDRNVAHAAVLARGLAEHLAAGDAGPAVGVTIAGRSTDHGRLLNVNKTLDHIVLSRLAEELAIEGGGLDIKVEVQVVHIGQAPWHDVKMAGLLLADLVSNLLFSGAKQFPELHRRVSALLAKKCPIRLTPRREKRRGAAILDAYGPAGYLVWFYGPLGPGKPDEEERERKDLAMGMLRDRESALPTLEALAQAQERQLLQVRNLDAAKRLAQAQLNLVRKVQPFVGSEGVLAHAYNAINCQLDVANHKGSVPVAKKVMRRERTARSSHGLGCLMQSLEFRNRAAETWVNAYDFGRAAAALDELHEEIIKASDLLGLGKRFPTCGRIISHRAQVHHYLGQDLEALEFYRQVAPHYDRAYDLEILEQHRTRSLIGLGRLSEARRQLEKLGVQDDLDGFSSENPFLLDLSILFLRVAMDRGRYSQFKALGNRLLDRQRWLPAAAAPHPGMATLKNLARIAARQKRAKLCQEVTEAGVTLLQADTPATLKTVAFSLCIEAVENLRDVGLVHDANEMLTLVRRLYKKLQGPGNPATLQEHFEPADVVLTWASPDDVTAEQAEAVTRLVPFGRVGGIG